MHVPRPVMNVSVQIHTHTKRPVTVFANKNSSQLHARSGLFVCFVDGFRFGASPRPVLAPGAYGFGHFTGWSRLIATLLALLHGLHLLAHSLGVHGHLWHLHRFPFFLTTRPPYFASHRLAISGCLACMNRLC